MPPTLAPPPGNTTSDAPALRLFIALWPDDAVRAALAAHQAQWQWPRSARRVAAERLHVTLHFLGDVAAAQAAGLQAALAEVEPPALRLAPAAAEVWHGGIAVLRLQPAAELAALHERLAEVLRRQGLQPERRPYRPHVTLARHAGGAQPAPLPAFDWHSRGFVLVASDRGPPPRYRVLQQVGG